MSEDIPSWPAIQRAAHYREQAAKLREFAAGELVEEVRERLIAVADQYEELAKTLLPSR